MTRWGSHGRRNSSPWTRLHNAVAILIALICLVAFGALMHRGCQQQLRQGWLGKSSAALAERMGRP